MESHIQIRLLYSVISFLFICSIFTTDAKDLEDCGKRLSVNNPLILNGQVVRNRTAWPWHAALFRKYGEGTGQIMYICGGSIIRKSAILTVGHCVTTTRGTKVEPDSLIVVINPFSSDFHQNQHVNSQIVNVKKIFVSESYDAQKDFQADIAILQLDQDIEFKDDLTVGPVCIPTQFEHDSNAVRPGKIGDVVGFGVDESESLSKHLRVGRLEIQSHSECYFKLQRTLSDSQFCAGSQRGESWVTVCNGDSGGGLFIPSIVDEKYYIHGLVSTGDASAAKGVCQNYAVFTRVISFLPWIRSVLKELGDNHQIISSDSLFRQQIPYVQNGTETRRRPFFPIPHEWRNKLTSLELRHVDIEPDSFLNSLEFSGKTIEVINLTHVKFTREFPEKRTVRLPHLKIISMDILKDEWNDWILESMSRSGSRSFQQSRLFQDFLNSLIFFKTDAEESEGVRDGIRTLAQLPVDVDITISIYKSIQISMKEGRISLSQNQFAQEILQNILKRNRRYWLKHLSLSKCPLNVSQILKNYGVGLKTLVFDQMEGIEDLASVVQNLSELEELVISTPTNLILNFNQLPKRLRHLALTRTRLNLNIDGHYFQSESSKLETLFCDQCLGPSTQNSIDQLNNIFPKLKRIVLKLNGNGNISHFQNFQNLESVYIENSMGKSSALVRKKGSGSLSYVNLKRSPFLHLKYVMNRFDNFWSSEGDYFGQTRLTPTEMISFRTGRYLFEGRAFPNSDYSTPNIQNENEDKFKRIPHGIQDKLEIIQVNNAQFARSELPYSLEFCKHLKVLSLVNASSVSGWPRIQAQLPQLQEYKLHSAFDQTFTYFGYNGLALLIDTALPIFFPYIEPNVDGKPFDIKLHFLRTRVQKVHIQYGECVALYWNAKEGSLVSSGRSYTNDWLRNVNPKHPIKKLAFTFWELDPHVIPRTLTHLNLNFAVLSDVGVKILFEKLEGLKDLRFVNVRQSADYTRDKWEWTSVDMAQLSRRFSNTLEYLVFEKIHLRNFQDGISLYKVETLFIESCTLEPEMVQNFGSIFPSLKNVIILGKNRELILSKVLKLSSVQTIVTSTEWKDQSTKGARELQQILRVSAAENKKHFASKYVILRRRTGAWGVHCDGNRICSPEVTNSEFGELGDMKGNTVFGTEQRCHAISFPQSSSHLSRLFQTAIGRSRGINRILQRIQAG